MTIRQNMIRAAARAMIVAESATSRAKWDFCKRMSNEEVRAARLLVAEWNDKHRGGDAVLDLAVAQIAEGVELG